MMAAFLGAIAWFVVGMMRFGDAVDDLQRVPIPGAGEVTLSEGKKSLYYEGPGGRIPPLRIGVVALPSGDAIRVGEHSSEVTYSISGHAGESVAGFTAPRDGRYRVVVEAPEAVPTGAQLAVGRGLGNRLVRVIVGAIVIFLVGGGVGTALIVSAASRRASPPPP